MAGSIDKTAVVIGAGIAGILSAAALAPLFDRVVVIERDKLPHRPEVRKGTPQSAHVHVLLDRGLAIAERFLPGTRATLLAAGAVPLRVGWDERVFDGAEWLPRREFGMTNVSQSRPVLEFALRQCLAQHANVEIRYETNVTAFDLNDQGAITGVQVATPSGRQAIQTNLAVDASGRASKSVRWLEQAGFGPLEVDEVWIGMSYVSGIFKRSPRWSGDSTGWRIANRDPLRGSVVRPIEDDRWIFTTSNYFNVIAPTDLEDMRAYLQTFLSPEIFECVRDGELEGRLRVYRTPTVIVRRFDKLPRMPAGYFPVGDNIAHLNPLGGQGMSVAAVHAEILADRLSARAGNGAGLDGFAEEFVRDAVAESAAAWRIMTMRDLQNPATKGKRPENFDEIRRIMRGIEKLAFEDAEIHHLTLKVRNMVADPGALRTPEIIERALAAA